MALVPRVLKTIGNSIAFRRCTLIPSTRFASTETSQNELQEVEYQDENEIAAAALEAKRNKSRLKTKHYKFLHGEISVDVENPAFPFEKTVAFRQRIVARYGKDSGIDQGIAWPTKEKLADMIEYEKVAHPFTIQEMLEKKQKIREEERKKIETRQKDIETKMGKLGMWMKELKDRQEKKLAVARAAQEKKDRLIEEVRQHFGYVVSMKDPKFQEMLELKEKEAKKAEKELKKKTRFDKASTKAMAEAEAISRSENKTDG